MGRPRALQWRIGGDGNQSPGRHAAPRHAPRGRIPRPPSARDAVGADVAIVTGGAIRGDRLYPAGTVLTRRDVLTELPFDNRTLKLEVTGAQLLAAMENAVSLLKQGAGRFPQISGMVVEVNSFAPAGARGARRRSGASSHRCRAGA